MTLCKDSAWSMSNKRFVRVDVVKVLKLWAVDPWISSLARASQITLGADFCLRAAQSPARSPGPAFRSEASEAFPAAFFWLGLGSCKPLRAKVEREARFGWKIAACPQICNLHKELAQSTRTSSPQRHLCRVTCAEQLARNTLQRVLESLASRVGAREPSSSNTRKAPAELQVQTCVEQLAQRTSSKTAPQETRRNRAFKKNGRSKRLFPCLSIR